MSGDGAHSIRSVLNWVEGSGSDGWYWRADATRNTLIGILNADSEEARVQVSLDYYSDGQQRSYELPELTLPARAAYLVDVGEIIASGLPDPDGDLIPPATLSGGYRVRKLDPDLTLTLTTEALVYDHRRKGFLSLYNTGTCYDAVRLIPDPLVGPVEALGQVILEGFNTTSKQWEAIPIPFYSSQNSAIASISSSGIVTGKAPGSTTVKGSQRIPKISFLGCAMQTMSDTSIVTVKPVINSISPLRGLIGVTTSVTITGNGFGSNPSVSAGSGISVTVSSATNAQISANFAIASSAPAGNHAVTVTVNGQTSNAVNFFVQVPTSLALVTTNEQGPANCGTGAAGWARNVTWRLRDQAGITIQRSGIVMADQISISATQNSCAASNPQTGQATTNSSGQFPDGYFICSSVCTSSSCQTNATQTWTANGIPLAQAVTIVYGCTSITLNGQ